MLDNFYSDNTGYNAKQLNIQSGTMGESVVFESSKFGTYTVSSLAELLNQTTILHEALTEEDEDWEVE